MDSWQTNSSASGKVVDVPMQFISCEQVSRSPLSGVRSFGLPPLTPKRLPIVCITLACLGR